MAELNPTEKDRLILLQSKQKNNTLTGAERTELQALVEKQNRPPKPSNQ